MCVHVLSDWNTTGRASHQGWKEEGRATLWSYGSRPLQKQPGALVSRKPSPPRDAMPWFWTVSVIEHPRFGAVCPALPVPLDFSATIKKGMLCCEVCSILWKESQSFAHAGSFSLELWNSQVSTFIHNNMAPVRQYISQSLYCDAVLIMHSMGLAGIQFQVLMPKGIFKCMHNGRQ